MKTLTVEKKNNCIYTMQDSNQNKINLNLEFFDFDLKIDDIILINDKLLNDIKDSITFFGSLKDKTGRNVLELSDDDVLLEIIAVKRNDNILYFKRLYG